MAGDHCQLLPLRDVAIMSQFRAPVPPMRAIKHIWFTMLCLLLGQAGMVAAPIPLTNPSFELPALGPGSYSVGDLPGWEKDGEINFIGNVMASNPWYSGPPAGIDGNLAGFFFLSEPGQTAGLYQILPVNYDQSVIYTLTVSFGLRSDGGVMREGTEFGFFTANHTLLATQPVTADDLNPSEFSEFSLSFQPLGDEGPICIGIINHGMAGSYVDFDDVRLSTGFEPPVLGEITVPHNRQVIQRRSDNRSNIPVSLPIQGIVGKIEARAVLMPGATNVGRGTGWKTLALNPAVGAFSGVLQDVPAGGWYRVEVRALDSAGQQIGAVIRGGRVGIGEVFIIAGQSNAASFGSPPQVPTNDKVSALRFDQNYWGLANDPLLDNTGFSGSGGSPWPRFGSRVAASCKVPVGLIGVVYGGVSVASYVPEGGPIYPILRSVVQSFPLGGFRSILWHEGESDGAESTSAADYATKLKSVISQTRIDAGWEVPWGVAQASYLNYTAYDSQQAVNAGQRNVCNTMPHVFRGARTDDFYLENKLSDGIHFNAAGLTDHGDQWADLLLDEGTSVVKNGDFESGLPLDDNDAFSGQIIGFNAINAAGTGATDAYVGVANPGPDIYLTAEDDGANGGVLPGMSGRNMAYIFGGSAGASLLHQFPMKLMGGTRYEIRVAIGIRSGAEVFGGYSVALMVRGNERARISGDRALLDMLAGGNAADHFTDVLLVYDSPSTITLDQTLDLLIQRPLGGPGVYLDVDNVRLTPIYRAYSIWQREKFGSSTSPNAATMADPDKDGVVNLLEFAVNRPPLIGSPGPIMEFHADGNLFVPKRRNGAGLTYALESSSDLISWTVENNAVQQKTPLGGDFESVNYVLPQTNGARRYYRMRLTLVEGVP